jgi:hypothetical protein
MVTLGIGGPDAEDDPEPQDVVTLGGEPDVFRAFTTMTRMAVKKYGKAGVPYPDLLMVPTYHMTDVVFTPDEFRQIQGQAQAFLAQERPTDELVIDVLNKLAPLPIWSDGGKDANARGEGDVRWTLKPPWFAPRGRGDDPRHFKHTYFMYCPDCGRMKVGGSSHLKRRLKDVRRAHQKKCRGLFSGPSPRKIELLGTVRGNQQAWFRRQKFPNLYTRPEWLIYGLRVRDYLAAQPRVRRYLAAHGRKLPPVPGWTPSLIRQAFEDGASWRHEKA